MRYLFLLFLISSQSIADINVIPLIRTADGHLVVKATINAVTADFILDTGATGTVLHTERLSEFRVVLTQKGFSGIVVGDEESGKVETFPVQIDSFALGAYQLQLRSIFANSSGGQFSQPIAGIVGQDALTELSALIDLKAPQLLVPDSNHDLNQLFSEQGDSQFSRVDLQLSKMGFRFVDAKLGDYEVRLLVDSGASQTVLDETTLAKLGFELNDHPTAKTIIAEGKEIPMKQIENSNLTIGGARLTSDFLTTDFTALLNAINDKRERQFVGVLGIKELIKLNAIVDLKNNTMYLKPAT